MSRVGLWRGRRPHAMARSVCLTGRESKDVRGLAEWRALRGGQDPPTAPLHALSPEGEVLRSSILRPASPAPAGGPTACADYLLCAARHGAFRRSVPT